MAGNAPPRTIVLGVLMLKLTSIAPPQLVSALASSIAARKVHFPLASAQIPSPGLASLVSPLSLTVRLIGQLIVPMLKKLELVIRVPVIRLELIVKPETVPPIEL